MLLDLRAGGVLPGSSLSWDIKYFDLHFLLCVCSLSPYRQVLGSYLC